MLNEVKHLGCISIVFEILHCVQDDKMKAYFYFETPSRSRHLNGNVRSSPHW